MELTMEYYYFSFSVIVGVGFKNTKEIEEFEFM